MYRNVRAPHAGRTIALDGETGAAVILLAAVFFNAVLALLNAHTFALSQTIVSLAEAGITASAITLVALNFRPAMLPWAALLAIIILLDLWLALANGALNPKYFRDVIDIPIFIALGMVYARGNVVRLFFWIQAIVLVFMFFELFAVDTYSRLFDIIGYYVNTRDLSQHSFWNTNSTLFVSATRPGDRFLLGIMGTHRLSSIFLEPVSLGNYSIIATFFTLAFWARLSRPMALFFIISTLLILVGSDGRLAAVTCVVLVVGSFLFPLLPRYSNVLLLPTMLLLAVAVVALFAFQDTADDFRGRLAGSIGLLTSLNAGALLGLDAAMASRALDSGISYFVITQSVFGVAAVWLFVCLTPRYEDRVSTVLIYSICTYITLNLLVSYSLFSIKTAAPMWFLFGYVLQSPALQRSTLQYARRPGRWSPARGPAIRLPLPARHH